MNFKEWIEKCQICERDIKWLGDRTAEQAWDACPYGDRLAWWLEEAGMPERDRQALALVFARRVEHYSPSAKALNDELERFLKCEIDEMKVSYNPEAPVAELAACCAALGRLFNTAIFAASANSASISSDPKATEYIEWNESYWQADYIRANYKMPTPWEEEQKI